MIRDTCLTWNKAANDVPGWPQLRVEVPNRRRAFAYPEESFPESFRRQVDAYQSRQPDVFSKGYCRPLSDITLKQRRQHIFLLATALVASGVQIEKLTALSVLVKPANVEAALRFLFERGGSKHTPFIAGLAILLVTIAKHHVGLKERQVDQLRGFARNLRRESKGFTELHPNLSQIYRDKVARLHDELNRPELREEASAAIRSLIDEVRLVPANGKLEIELAGALAGILALTSNNPRRVGRGLQVMLVAGEGNHRQLTLPPIAV